MEACVARDAMNGDMRGVEAVCRHLIAQLLMLTSGFGNGRVCLDKFTLWTLVCTRGTQS